MCSTVLTSWNWQKNSSMLAQSTEEISGYYSKSLHNPNWQNSVESDIHHSPDDRLHLNPIMSGQRTKTYAAHSWYTCNQLIPSIYITKNYLRRNFRIRICHLFSRICISANIRNDFSIHTESLRRKRRGRMGHESEKLNKNIHLSNKYSSKLQSFRTNDIHH